MSEGTRGGRTVHVVLGLSSPALQAAPDKAQLLLAHAAGCRVLRPVSGGSALGKGLVDRRPLG